MACGHWEEPVTQFLAFPSDERERCVHSPETAVAVMSQLAAQFPVPCGKSPPTAEFSCLTKSSSHSCSKGEMLEVQVSHQQRA